ALPGVGPALSQRILDARKQGEFKDWNDFMTRVNGVKEKAAAKLSGAGLTVGGKPYVEGAKAAAAAAPAAKK
ncbi:MAG: helix-hairpin-helix domain-containing protein, partial [Comamonadaceae bacterium]